MNYFVLKVRFHYVSGWSMYYDYFLVYNSFVTARRNEMG